MAPPKRPSALEDPPAASSSSSEEETEEEGVSEDESEQEQPQNKKVSPPPPSAPLGDKKSASSSLKKPDPQPQSSSTDDGAGTESESGSEAESDSDSDMPPRPPSAAADPTIRPLASKPMDDAAKLKRPRSKPSGAASATTPKSSAAKRPIDSVEDARDSKRGKKKVTELDGDVDMEEKKPGEDGKKQMFQRLWSEDDEIAILKGMIEYTSKKGVDPWNDMNLFHDFIKKSLHVDVSKTQLQDKVRRLKKKYETNASKAKKGEDRPFSKPHDKKSFELSKKIWGGGEANNGGGGAGGAEQSKSNGKPSRIQKPNKRFAPPEKEKMVVALRSPVPKEDGAKKKVEENSSSQYKFLKRSIGFGKNTGGTGWDGGILQQGLELIGDSKKTELDEEWRKLEIAEGELYLKRLELLKQQTKLSLDAIEH